MAPRVRPAPLETPTKPIPRVRVSLPPPKPAIIPASSVEFVTSGSHLLDRVLGGGWAQGRVVNVVGDKSSGKTLLAIETCANYARQFSVADIRYVEAEAAFDAGYAQTIGMPPGIELESNVRTVEHWETDLMDWVGKRKNSRPCLYVIDSLDALSDTAEMARKIDEGSYGAAKAKQISEFFRKRIKEIEAANCCLFVISQIRDKLNVTYGKKTQRAGGHAMDFYASQAVWLVEKGKIKRTVLGMERVIGMNVTAKAEKNKVGIPFRDCDLSIYFSYGVDDEMSMLDWIARNRCENLLALGVAETRKAVLAARQDGDRAGLALLHEDIASSVTMHWDRIEALLAPTISKYGS